MKDNKKKKVIILIIIFTIILFLGATYAIIVDYLSKTGKNSSLVVGDIYMHYNEGNKQISLTNAVPSNTYSNEYFEFTVDGKNTSNKDINYLISLSYGDTPNNRNTRIKDNLLDFKLVSVDNNTETVLIDNINFFSLNGAKLYTESVPSNTNNYLKTYRLYMKISYNTVIGNINEDYTIDEWNDVFASVKVNVSGTFDKIIMSDILAFKEMVLNEKKNTYIIENDAIYLSGSNNNINYNYVWYSGKLWRITAINPDGTMKMITDDPITTISYNPDGDVNFYDISKKDDTTYTGSYMYQWLNEDFLDTLYNHENIIVEDSTWNITTSGILGAKLPETTLINNSTIGKNTPVGLLNSYEYYLSYKNTSSPLGYLNMGYYWWLITPSNSYLIWNIDSNGYSSNYNYPSSSNVARPSINLKSNIQLVGGSGTKDNPYRIAGDKEDVTPNTTYLNTRSSGEYVIFDEDGSSQTSELYRIVSIKDGKVKLNKNDYIKSGTTVVKKKFSTSNTYGNGTTDDYWDYYLNNTWYNGLANKDMIESSSYYIKQVSKRISYKNSLCSTNNATETTKNCTKTTSIWTGLVGLPRYGEMFVSQQGNGNSSSSNIWLITPYSSSDSWIVYGNGSGNSYDPSNSISARPSIYLKSNIVITGGDGTKTNPFTIALKAK